MENTSTFSESINVQFWEANANRVQWIKHPTQILSQNDQGLYRWYQDGIINTCYLAIDKHIEDGLGDQVAIQYESPMTNVSSGITFNQLYEETTRIAGVLRHLGIEKGDRVIIYMPMIPEAIFAILACARLGAIHSVVFGGFAAHELALRIEDAKPKAILTSSAGIEFDKVLPYLPLVLQAWKESSYKVPRVVVKQRSILISDLTQEEFLFDWDGLKKEVQPFTGYAELNSTDPLYILYTSGTTGKPKGVERDNGGHAVALLYSMEHIYGLKRGDVFWAASDLGWVVGHSFIVYGPLLAGCTTILYEGKPVRTPDEFQFWRIIEKNKVNVLFTAPTAIRAIKKENPDLNLRNLFDLSSLRHLFLAGERCDGSTLSYAQTLLNIPVIDHWWQTESGWPMLGNPVGDGLFEIKSGSAGKPISGYNIQVLNQDSIHCDYGEEGSVAIKLPLPPGFMSTLWNSDDRFKESYLSQFDGYYFTGDGGFKDKDGYFFITGRIDDVINVSGHRLSTADMEEILSSHDVVAECAVVGIDHELKGQIPIGLVTLKAGKEVSLSTLEKETVEMVRKQLGAFACFSKVYIVSKLPKTRSGKILRRLIRSIADNKPYQVPSTIEDLSVIDDLNQLFQK
jgi:acyl-coenzyme A synthetase/AMP-(fatty) acid ligase